MSCGFKRLVEKQLGLGRCLCGEAAVVGGLNKSEWMYCPPGQSEVTVVEER